jgi:MFS family permease
LGQQTLTGEPAVAGPPAGRVASLRKRVSGSRMLDLFALRDFRWLWLGTLAFFMGMNMQMVARAWLVLRLADDSPLALAIVMGSFALPVILVSPFGGALSDRVPRKHMLLVGQSVTAALTVGVAALDLTGHIAFWHLIVSGLINGSTMAVNMPSRQVLVSDIVPESRLMNAVAMASSGMNLTRILGPAVAGVLIIYIGTAGVFFVVGGLYLLAVLTTAMLRVRAAPAAPSGGGMIGDIKAGLNYATGNPVILGLIIMAFMPVMFGMSYYALLPAWAREALNVQSDNLGYLMMTMGAGALVGTLLLAGIRNFSRRGLLLLVTCALWGVALGGFAKTTSYAAAVPLLLATGLTSSIFMSLNMTLLQSYSSPEMRGRVMSIAMMTFGLMPLSAVPFGALAEIESVGTANALLLSGILLTVFTIIFAIVYAPFRRIA